MKPEFTVLMSNYNNERYIAEAIESVIAQTFTEWELIIVDDCSTDDSIKTIKPYLKDKRVKLYRNRSNKGFSHTLKKAIKKSKTEILGILDSDDTLKKEALKIMYNSHLRHPECGLIYSQYVFCNKDMIPLKKGHSAKIPKNDSNINHFCVGPFRTLKETHYQKTGGLDEELSSAQDHDLTFKMEEVSKLFFTDKILYNYRIHRESMSYRLRGRETDYRYRYLATYNAYQRRLNKEIPSITKEKAAETMYKAAMIEKKKKGSKTLEYLEKAMKLSPIKGCDGVPNKIEKSKKTPNAKKGQKTIF
ncbi:MAG: glycosyltransferase [Candidatus Altiarchaeota archaeon]|nr:glycosyltransferase [Candidatus Altiarchaeota archaeon]